MCRTFGVFLARHGLEALVPANFPPNPEAASPHGQQDEQCFEMMPLKTNLRHRFAQTQSSYRSRCTLANERCYRDW